MATTPFLQFLVDATTDENLHSIRLEVHGEVDAETVVKAKKKRLNSRTLQDLVDEYNPKDCRDASTDWTCLLDFLQDSIEEFDFSTTSNGSKRWADEAFNVLDQWLKKLQRLTMAAQRNDSEGLRAAMVKINRRAKAYLLATYPKQQKLENEIYEKHWRKIIHGDRGVVLKLLDEKAQREAMRLENKFEIAWSHITTTLRRYAGYLDLPDEEFTSSHATALEFAIECNAGPRKIGVLDPHIKFYTYDGFKRHLKSLSITQPTVFRIGDEDSSIVFPDDEEAINAFKKQNILCQVGVAKDSRQSQNAYIEIGDDRYVDGAVVFKTTIFFSAKDTIRMINRVRKFFNLTMKTRPVGPQARVKMGTLIGSRLTTKVLEADWKPLVSHARKHGFQLGSHIFRKIYAVALASRELGYLANIHSLTGRRIDAVVLQAHCLRHTGSYATVQAYSNLHIDWGLAPDVLKSSDPSLLRQLLDRVDHLEQEVSELRQQRSAPVLVPIPTSSQEMTAIQRIRAGRNLSGDEDIKFVAYSLLKAGLKPSNKNILAAGVGKGRLSKYKKSLVKGQPIVPPDWQPPNAADVNAPSSNKKRPLRQESKDHADEGGKGKRQKKPSQKAKAKNFVIPEPTVQSAKPKLQQKLEAEHPGMKVVVPQSGSDNNKQNQIRRAGETFGKDNVIIDCPDPTEPVKFAPKLTRKLCKDAD